MLGVLLSALNCYLHSIKHYKTVLFLCVRTSFIAPPGVLLSLLIVKSGFD